MTRARKAEQRRVRPREYSAHVIAELLEITPRRLQQLVAEGWIERPAHGRYYLIESVRGYIRYLKSSRHRKS